MESVLRFDGPGPNLWDGDGLAYEYIDVEIMLFD